MSKYQYENGKITRNGIMVRGPATGSGVAKYSEHEHFNKDLTFLLNLAVLLREDPGFLDRLNKIHEIGELVQELA